MTVQEIYLKEMLILTKGFAQTCPHGVVHNNLSLETVQEFIKRQVDNQIVHIRTME